MLFITVIVSVGSLFVDQEIPDENDEKGLSVEFGGTVEKGGWWAPTTCQPRAKVSLAVVPRQIFANSFSLPLFTRVPN